ncbi:MAG: type II toxin-antitoxin system VapC family toxin [Acidimicrobiaceae bacterium]|nr:type II toxin-antitoxin system VapC family toxin [Acidimicrobiaceae bacterium]
MRAVDTDVLLRLLVRDDADQVARAEAFVAQGAWVSLTVLLETTCVLESTYGLSRQRIGTILDMLVEHDRLTLQDEDAVRRACALFARERAPGFSDCLIVEVACKAGHGPVGTFDKRMTRLDGTQRL